MGDPAGDVGPGRGALRRNQLGDVVEGQHRAVVLLALLLVRHAHGEIALLAADDEGDLMLRPALVLVGTAQHGGKLRHRLGERAADELGSIATEELLRRAVGKRDAVVAIETDDTRRHAGEHGLHEAAPLGELGVGGDEVRALALQLLGHGVEVHRQAAQVPLATPDRQLDLQVALGDVLGGADQPADRRHEAARKPDPRPDRGQQRGQRDHEIHHAVRKLEAAANLAQALVGPHPRLRAPQVPHHFRVDAAGDVEIGVRVVAKLGQRGDAEGVARHQQRHLPALGRTDQVLRRSDVGDLLILEHGHLHRALGIDHIGDGQVAQAGLRKHQLAKLARVGGDLRCRIVEVLGHVDDVGADHLPMLVQVGVRHVERVEHDRHGLLVEPVVEGTREGGGGGNGEQQGGHCRNQAEEQDDAGMQARAGYLFLPGAPQPHDVHRDDGHHRDHE